MAPLRIAVIGSGVSGLSAAWLLSHRHNVTLLEADSRIGGHANTVICTTPEGKIAVDTGFIVYNEATYPNLSAFFAYLKVPVAETTMGFGVSLDGGRIEYAGRGLRQLAGNIRNLADPAHWQMLAGIVRFFRTSALRATNISEDVSLRDFLRDEGYSKAFIERHLLPMAGAIWSSHPAHMLDYPAKAFLQFFDNHDLLKFRNRSKWRTVVGGSREYIDRLTASSRMTILLNHRVTGLSRDRNGVALRIDGGGDMRFDHVVLATHADQALALLDKPTPAEHQCLSAFTYSVNEAVLHGDATLMPKRRHLWSSWNYIGEKRRLGCSITYWMNALQPLATTQNFFVTLNPARAPAAGTEIARFIYEHPVLDAKAMAAQRKLWHLQGQMRTWFCGAHFGAGFHEDGLQAGLAVAEALGGTARPWQIPNAPARICVTETSNAMAGHLLEAAE